MHRLSLGLLALFVFTISWGTVVSSLVDILWGVALVCALVTCMLQGRIKRPPALLYVAVGLVLWQLVTYYWSVDPSSSLARVRLMLFILAMVWMVTEVCNSERERLLLAQAFVLGCFVLCGVIFYAFVSGGTTQAFRYVPSYLNPNDAADLLAAGVAIALLLIASRPGRLLQWVNIVFIPLAFAGVFLTASRSGFIIACLAAAGIFFVLRSIKPVLRFAWVAVVLAALVMGFYAVAGSESLGWNLERMTFQTDTNSLGTLTGRTTIWSAGAEQFKEHPIIGAGAGTFGLAVRDELGATRAAHNVFIETAVETGVIGLCFLAAAFAAAGAPVLRRRDHRTGIRMLLLLVMIGTCLVANVSARYSLWFVLALLAKTGAEWGAPTEAICLSEAPGAALVGLGKRRGVGCRRSDMV